METFIIIAGIVIYLIIMAFYAVMNYQDRGLFAAAIGTAGLWILIGNWCLVLWAVMPISAGGAIAIAMIHMVIGFTLMGWAER